MQINWRKTINFQFFFRNKSSCRKCRRVSGLGVYRTSNVQHQLILKKSIAELVQHFFQ